MTPMSIGEAILMLEHLIIEAREKWVGSSKDEQLEALRLIADVAVTCMSLHGKSFSVGR